MHWLENHRSTECPELEELRVCAKGVIKTVLGLNTRFLISKYEKDFCVRPKECLFLLWSPSARQVNLIAPGITVIHQELNILSNGSGNISNR